MRVLLLGSSGLLGRAALTRLASKHEVVCAIHANSDISWPRIVRLDVTDPKSFPDEKFDAVVNCAAFLGNDISKLINVNCSAFLNTINWALNHGVQRFAHISSIQVIGHPQILPIDENHPEYPQTLYHASKLFAEKTLALPQFTTLNPVILRVPAPLGPGMNPNSIIPTFLRNAKSNRNLLIYGQGTRRQNYMDVEDIAEAIERSLEVSHSGLYNLSGPRTISNLEAARTCIDICLSTAKIFYSDKPDNEESQNWQIDSQKIKNDMNFSPTIPFEESLRKLLQGL